MSRNENSLAYVRQKTQSISFRLDANELAQLRDLANQKKTTLNTLVSQIIDKYLKLWVYNHQYGFFSVNTEVLRETFVKLNDKDIERIAKDKGERVHKSIILYLFGKVTKETVVKYLDVFGERFETYRHFKEGRKHTVIISHNVAIIQFSKFYYGVLKSILALANIQVLEGERDISQDSFSLSFELPS
jgi:hypothetical protein